MKSTQLKTAIKLLEQLEKLQNFFDEAPAEPDTITITFKKGVRSKSVSLSDPETVKDLQQDVQDLVGYTDQWLADMGIDTCDDEMVKPLAGQSFSFKAKTDGGAVRPSNGRTESRPTVTDLPYCRECGMHHSECDPEGVGHYRG